MKIFLVCDNDLTIAVKLSLPSAVDCCNICRTTPYQLRIVEWEVDENNSHEVCEYMPDGRPIAVAAS